MKLFDLDKWERKGQEELDAARAEQARLEVGAGKPRTWILTATGVLCLLSAIMLLANGVMQAKGVGHYSFGTPGMFYGGAGLLTVIGIAYIVGVLAGRTAASTKAISFSENVITLICVVLIALVSVVALLERLFF